MMNFMAVMNNNNSHMLQTDARVCTAPLICIKKRPQITIYGKLGLVITRLQYNTDHIY